MPKRKRLLFVTNSLQKAGSEKYTFEIVKNIDKSLFDVEVLTTADVHLNKKFPHVYYFELRKLGIKIHTILYRPGEIQPSFINRLPLKKVSNYILFRINRYRRSSLYNKRLSKLFSSFDAVILVDALFFHHIKNNLDPGIYFETHLMCHQAQFNRDFKIYDAYDKNSTEYNFVYADEYQLSEIEAQEVKIKNTFGFPLSINVDDLNPVDYHKIVEKKEFNIGVFTRINRIKPIDKILEAFEILKSLNAEVKLKIFGHIQDPDYHKELMEIIKNKGLIHHISFEGHAENMLEGIKEKNVSLAWIVSIYEYVGYAATELCMNNIPIILDNIDGNNSIKPIDNETSIPPYFYTPSELAKHTHYIISNNKLEELQQLETDQFLSHHDLEKNISKYEQYLLKTLKNQEEKIQ